MASGRRILVALLICFILATSVAAHHGKARKNLHHAISTLKSSGRFETLVGLLKSTKLVSSLESLDELTLLAPTDFAFANAQKVMGNLTLEQLIKVIEFHVLPQFHDRDELASLDNMLVPTIASDGARDYQLTISGADGIIFINTGINQAIVTDDIFQDVPVMVYEINAVLIPKEIGAAAGMPPLPALAPAFSNPASPPAFSHSAAPPVPAPFSHQSPAPAHLGPAPSPFSLPSVPDSPPKTSSASPSAASTGAWMIIGALLLTFL